MESDSTLLNTTSKDDNGNVTGSTEHRVEFEQFYETDDYETCNRLTSFHMSSDSEDTDSEASFHSIIDDLEDSGAAFTSPRSDSSSTGNSAPKFEDFFYHRYMVEKDSEARLEAKDENEEKCCEQGTETKDKVEEAGIARCTETLERGEENFRGFTSHDARNLSADDKERSQSFELDATANYQPGKCVGLEERLDACQEQNLKDSECTKDKSKNYNSSEHFSEETELKGSKDKLEDSEDAHFIDRKSESSDEGRREDNVVEYSMDDPDYFNLECVKALDAEWELKLKDRDLNASDGDLTGYVEAAVTAKREGNILFTRDKFSEAIDQYNIGLQQCPLVNSQNRAMLYHNRAVAYHKLEEHKLAVHSLDKALEHDGSYCKAMTRRAELHEKLENLDEALQDYKKLLELDPRHSVAREAVMRLPQMIEERNEKLKAEMLGKLKDLGNMFLRPFGLSTENFQLQQDPSSGGYNISFKSNHSN